MDSLLWSNILAFDFDKPLSEYSFSTRLASENYWSTAFTEKAILEYKKFMYLAAISDLMVSPSEIIDNVWHQHLIFSQSYQEFCNLLEKNIQHVPSTHRKEENLKFKKARERTKQLYVEHFKEQPIDIWAYSTMYDSLRLKKASVKIRSFLVAGLLVFFLLITPFVILLKPVYIHIGNPDFLIYTSLFTGLIFLVLEIYNHSYLKGIFKDVDDNAFLYHLNAAELIYLKTQNLANVVHSIMNNLVLRDIVLINSDQGLLKRNQITPHSFEEFQVLSAMPSEERIYYQDLQCQLVLKPIFLKLQHSMDALKKYVVKSHKFGRLFYMNFLIIAIPLMLSLSRLIIGLMRQKAVTHIGIMVFLVVCLSIYYLHRLTQLAATKTIPSLYKDSILSSRADSNSIEWQYFLFGSAILAPSLMPLVNRADQSASGGDTGSCSSSCGSGGGSGCGGCGGD
jgi:hypothetical protein